MNCYCHDDQPAVGEIVTNGGTIDACVECLAETIREDIYDVDFYPDIPHEDGEGAVIDALAGDVFDGLDQLALELGEAV